MDEKILICKKCQKKEIYTNKTDLCIICSGELFIKKLDDFIARLSRDGMVDEFGNPAPEYDNIELLRDAKMARLQESCFISRLEQSQRKFEDDIKKKD